VSENHEHVLLLAGWGKNGKPSHELTPARHLGGDEYLILGTPGLANGCAAGDRVRVDESGAFVVVERGPNVAVHFYASSAIPEADLHELRAPFEHLEAAVEWSEPRRFVVVTVPVDAGFPRIEAIVNEWIGRHPDVEWNYGNVYGEDGAPLGWWA